MPHRPAFAPLSLLLLCAGSRLQAPPDAATLKPVPETIRPGFDSITPEQCREWLTVIASDEMGGRATGTAGYEKAARYVAERFKEFGLKPVGDLEGDLERYFQKVPFGEVVANPAESHLLVRDGEGKEVVRVAFGDGVGGFVNANADRAYELVLIRASTQKELDDLVTAAGGLAAATDGKATLLLDRSSPTSRPVSRPMILTASSPAGPPPRRPLTLGRGRRGELQTEATPGIVIRIDDRQAGAPTGRPVYLGPRRGATFNPPRLNSYAVTTDVARKLLLAAGIDAKELDREEPGLIAGGEARLAVKVQTMEKPAFAVNVVGLLEGSDPKLKEEVVGVGSHLDHIGTGPDGRVNNGADDDGSGTTGVLAVARALALNPVKPKRSILFMCFCAEELGLQGSMYYSLRPVIENARMVAELQMDMIGRNEESRNEKAEDNFNTLHLVGTKKLSDELHEICMSTNKEHVGFDYEFDEESVFSRSDHVNFAKEDIPIAFFFTGFHPQYHRHDDEVALIDFGKLSRVAKLVYLIGFDVADREARVKVDRTWAEVEAQERGSRQPRTRPASRPASQPVR